MNDFEKQLYKKGQVAFWESIKVYLNDILIDGPEKEEIISNLEEYFNHLPKC